MLSCGERHRCIDKKKLIGVEGIRREQSSVLQAVQEFEDLKIEPELAKLLYLWVPSCKNLGQMGSKCNIKHGLWTYLLPTNSGWSSAAALQDVCFVQSSLKPSGNVKANFCPVGATHLVLPGCRSSPARLLMPLAGLLHSILSFYRLLVTGRGFIW